MSYLEMTKAPLPNMTSGIISLWFRDLTKGIAPKSDEWPSGRWEEGGASMLPPDTIEIVQRPGYKEEELVFYWNAYGIPLSGTGGAIAGNAAVVMPSPPPLSFSSMRMMLTFGDDAQVLNYYPWELEYPDVVPSVVFFQGLAIIYNVLDFPPPYKPYFHTVGKDGKFKVANMKIAKTPTPKSNMVPQSFIGLDKDGFLTICLQTNTRAQFKGYAFQLDKFEEIWATQTIFVGVPPSPVDVQGKYWDGFLFHYKDISNEVMGGAPESFVLGGAPAGLETPLSPRITDSTWHHLLFSFDIRGSATSVLNAFGDKATATTSCKAWLALDDKNYADESLQHRIKIPNGITAPQLPGMGSNGVFPFGPTSSFRREDLRLKKNDILPQSAWVSGFFGNPRDGLPQYYSAAGLSPGNPYVPEGHFNFFSYTGVEWLLAGSPADGLGRIDPPYPTNPDPAKDFPVQTYQCSGFSIPVAGKPIGVPAGTKHRKHNTGVEMGELQIWANRTLDTSLTENRRMFIDKDGKPVPPTIAREILGRPDILLHGSGNWKNGRNTGAAGVDSEGKIKPDGQFVPVAKIERFTPNPQLSK